MSLHPTSDPTMRMTRLPTSLNIRTVAISDGGPKNTRINFLSLLFLLVPISAAAYLF